MANKYWICFNFDPVISDIAYEDFLRDENRNCEINKNLIGSFNHKSCGYVDKENK